MYVCDDGGLVVIVVLCVVDIVLLFVCVVE